MIFDSCNELLSVLCVRVSNGGKLNVLHLHVHSENFFATLLNLLYHLELTNLNAIEQNAEGIDLVDAKAKVILQVSAKATKGKVESSLAKDLAAYAGHTFRFMAISQDASHLHGHTYTNPHHLVFDPKAHIHDVPALLKALMQLPLTEQWAVYEHLRQSLGQRDEDLRLKESNIAAIINLLAKEDLSTVSDPGTAVEFAVEQKIAFNGLVSAAGVIEDHAWHGPRVERIYDEFDRGGVNKSHSVLQAFRNSYHQLRTQYTGDELFFQIVNAVSAQVAQSSNYAPIASEELQLCMNVLAVDAFTRCKIFKHPKDGANATA